MALTSSETQVKVFRVTLFWRVIFFSILQTGPLVILLEDQPHLAAAVLEGMLLYITLWRGLGIQLDIGVDSLCFRIQIFKRVALFSEIDKTRTREDFFAPVKSTGFLDKITTPKYIYMKSGQPIPIYTNLLGITDVEAFLALIHCERAMEQTKTEDR